MKSVRDQGGGRAQWYSACLTNIRALAWNSSTHIKKLGTVALLCNKCWGVFCMDRWIPRTRWPVSLAKSIRFRCRRDPASKKQCEEWWRKTPDADPWPPHTHICAHTHMNTSYTHTHAHTYTKHLGPLNVMKNHSNPTRYASRDASRCFA